MKLDYCAIGMRIKERRTKKEWSQEMLASTVGISNPHMSNIERGKTKVSLATLIDIANPLDTTLDALICDNLVKGKAVFDEESYKDDFINNLAMFDSWTRIAICKYRPAHLPSYLEKVCKQES